MLVLALERATAGHNSLEHQMALQKQVQKVVSNCTKQTNSNQKSNLSDKKITWCQNKIHSSQIVMLVLQYSESIQ